MKQETTDYEPEFDARDLFLAIRKKMWVIFITGITFSITIFLTSYYVIEWKYESTTQIYILGKQDEIAEITYADLQISSQLIKDFMALIKSRLVTEQVIDKLGLDIKHEELVKLIRVENPEDTRILKITVKYKDPLVAKQIADEVRETTTAFINTVTDLKQVSGIEEANIAENPITPNVVLNTILGTALGLIISAFIIVLIYLFDNTIKTPEDIEKYLAINVLSIIPSQKNKSVRGKFN